MSRASVYSGVGSAQHSGVLLLALAAGALVACSGSPPQANGRSSSPLAEPQSGVDCDRCEATRRGGRADSDDDSLSDEDLCPDAPVDVDGFQGSDGCPGPDNDGDSVLDDEDLCPDAPEDADGFQDSDGCPDPDNDGDHLLDACDRCPDAPETYNGYHDVDGCPDRGTLLAQDRVVFEHARTAVSFSDASAELSPEAVAIVDAVAEELRAKPYIHRIAIEGHADSGERDGEALSEARGAAVLRALLARGIDARRLAQEAFASQRPLTTLADLERRGVNRRVEFRLLHFGELPPLREDTEYLSWRASIPQDCPAARAEPLTSPIRTPPPNPRESD